MNQGDYVIRKSYGGDVVFRIERMEGNVVLLRGVAFRLMADAPAYDLEKVDDPFALQGEKEDTRTALAKTVERLRSFRRAVLEKTVREMNYTEAGSFFEVPGKVLHLDGDASYLNKSMDLYKELRVPAEGYHVGEAEMADTLLRLLPSVRPNVLVITGHDGMYKKKEEGNIYPLSNYKNSRHFVEAVQVARQYDRSLDSLIIVAGACQSHFEALLQAGANFASSPGRILIHAMDPVQIAARIAYTSMKDTVHISNVIEHTMSGMKGIGGIETRGCFRIGLPNLNK